MDDDATVLVDARGHRCPVPTLRLRRALERLPEGGRARLLADDPMAKVDVPHFAAQAGYRIVTQCVDGAVLDVTVEKPGPATTG